MHWILTRLRQQLTGEIFREGSSLVCLWKFNNDGHARSQRDHC